MTHLDDWQDSWGAFDPHPSVGGDPERMASAFDRYLERLTDGNYPFHHPRYAGQMLKPPHPVAIAAYLAAMRINPNNHALDGGPPTSAMEKEVVADLAAMLGLPDRTLGHLTGGGTVANLEALWVARHEHPKKSIAFSADAHYTHGRMSEVLGLDTVLLPTDPHGRVQLGELADAVAQGQIGTVVLTPGTTGLGSVDPIQAAIDVCRSEGVRVHVDAAYGGFFRLLAHEEASPLDNFPVDDFRAIARADSVVIDPHKHGLQPYGCGCILFRDPTVGRFYKHDSPYTYFTSDDLHLGEISLECSRAGAAAGALWCTLEALPLSPTDGVGAIVAACCRAARRWAEAVREAEGFTLYAAPQTDIVASFPTPVEPTLSAVHDASQRLFETAMHDPDAPIFTSLYRVPADAFTDLHPVYTADRDDVAVLRSVLMKPEHETHAPALVEHLAAWADNGS